MSALSRVKALVKDALASFLDRLLQYRWFLFVVALVDSIIIYYISKLFPLEITVLLGGLVVFGSIFLLYYSRLIRRLGVLPVTDDLTFILIHARCLVTGNPPLTLLFSKIGEAPFYSKHYKSMFAKIGDLVKNWGYSAPEALRLVSREAKSKVDEMFLQRFSAIVATGGDVKEYLRLEYNTLFSEYKSAYLRMIDMMRVVLGVYTTLLGALTFMLATLMLLGMIFGNVFELVVTGIAGVGVSLLGLDVLFFVFIKKPLFEARKGARNRLMLAVKFTGLSGVVFASILLAYTVITGRIFSLDYVALTLLFSGFSLLPAAVLVKVHEGRINEYDMFFPAFIRSYGEHIAVLPNMVESLKPLLIAELGKLRNLLRRVYAQLANRIDPRIAWRNFAGESASENVSRCTHVFVDAVEVGSDLGEAGALLSDHVNELYRLRANYIQVFKTFEVTLYIMHVVTVLLMIFVSSFVDVFSSIIQAYIGELPGEFFGILSFFSISKHDISFLVNTILLVVSIADILALCSVNPGSRYAVYYYMSTILILTGIGLYVGNYVIGVLMSNLVQIGGVP